MTLLGRVKRSVAGNPFSTPFDWYRSTLGIESSFAGETVNVTTSLGLVPVWRAVQILAGSVGSLPLLVYKGEGADRTRDTGTRAWQLLHEQPNSDQAADELWALIMSHLATWGNAFLWKERGGDGRIANLWPLDPRRFMVGRDLNTFQRYFVLDGRNERYTTADILHIRGLSPDALVGYSPIQLAREELGAQLAGRDFKGNFWANDARPGVILKHPNKLSPEAATRLKADWDAAHRGPTRAQKTAVLEDGMDISTLTMPLADAQFIEQQRMDRTTVALLFGLPPYMLAGDSGGSLTYSTTEAQSNDFVTYSLRHWLVRIEKSLGRGDAELLTSGQACEFDADQLLRATMLERFKAYSLADFLTKNDKRIRENEPPLEGGDGFDVNAPKVPSDAPKGPATTGAADVTDTTGGQGA